MLVAVPGVNLVLGPVAMMVAGLRGGSRRAEPARSNGRRAASWGLTFLLGEVLLIGAQLYIGQVVFGPGERVTLFPWGLPSVFGLILMVSHFVVCIVQGGAGRIGAESPVSEGSPSSADREVLMGGSTTRPIAGRGRCAWRSIGLTRSVRRSGRGLVISSPG